MRNYNCRLFYAFIQDDFDSLGDTLGYFISIDLLALSPNFRSFNYDSEVSKNDKMAGGVLVFKSMARSSSFLYPYCTYLSSSFIGQTCRI